MKIDANVELSEAKAKVAGKACLKIPVDVDVVTPYESDICEYVANELAEMFGCSFGDDEFEITNIEDLIEDIKFDEFKDKTQYANM